ncbi:glutathione S-transferase t2-like protein [Trifolium pratense]|uniref:Glutathione S-transferase t2-like protein n=2 Tax=Trifolium pratense TaxID=57577 RepID=A0A2K3JKM3_TRIPR|nr:glutathione S-transferase t2-like protein [Trifolium pratense]
MCQRPPVPIGDGSQNPQPFMFQSPPFSTGNNSQYPRPFMFQPSPTNISSQYTHSTGTNDVVESPNVESESPIGSTTDSQVPVFSTQVGLENITFAEGENSTQKKQRVRFLEEEDKLVIQTWLNVSKDSVVGNDQKSDCFWGRIKDRYNNYRGSLIAREWSTLKSRWHLLNKHCQWFCGSYKLAVANKKSGQSETDIMDEARKLFAQVHHQRFTMEHAWRLLKDEPKWKGQEMNNSSKRSKTSSTGTYSSTSNPENPIDCSEYNSATQTDRPLGQKAAKRKGKGKETSSTTPIVDLTGMENASEKKLVVYGKIAEARLAESIPMLYEILMKDKSTMNDEQRREHEEICRSIKEKYFK